MILTGIMKNVLMVRANGHLLALKINGASCGNLNNNLARGVEERSKEWVKLRFKENGMSVS